MEDNIVNTLISLTNRTNDDIKIAAINALGEYKAAIGHKTAIERLLLLCKDPNKSVAISAINSISKL